MEITFLLILAYFMPSIIALLRKHKNFAPVFFLNLLLGWTFLGWLVAFIWSLTYQDT